MREEAHLKALQVNYDIGNYGIKYCSICGYPIERYENIEEGLCEECKEEV